MALNHIYHTEALMFGLTMIYIKIYSESIAMQYALYTTTFIATIGGGFFLFTVEEDKAVSIHIHMIIYFLVRAC